MSVQWGTVPVCGRNDTLKACEDSNKCDGNVIDDVRTSAV
jgi:hypothetical protein